MILDDKPRFGRIVIEVWRPLMILALWNVAVTILYLRTSLRAPELPIALFGTVLGLFLGFRDNSAYQRWWEGRILWGSMINASRSFARAVHAFLPSADAGPLHDLRRTLVLRQIAYVHALRCQLRRHDPSTEIHRQLSSDEAAVAIARANPANALLEGTSDRIAEATRAAHIDTIQQAQFEDLLVDMSNAQGGMERLKNTPLPMQYRFFPALFTRLFCALLPIGLVETLGIATPFGSTIAALMFLAALQIGDDLVDPFGDTVHDVPLNAMCGTIEIDLKQAIGDEAPPPVQPVKGILW